MINDGVWYPTPEFVLKLHKLVANEGLRDAAGLEFICHKVQSKQYSSMWDKAAFLLHSIATTHPFFNGNKRTALVTTLFFLTLNRYAVRKDLSEDECKLEKVPDYAIDAIVIHYNDEETMEFILEIAKYKKSIKEVKEFLERKLKN